MSYSGEWGLYKDDIFAIAGKGGVRFNYEGIKCVYGKAHPVIHAGDQICIAAAPRYNDRVEDIIEETGGPDNRKGNWPDTTWESSKFVIESDDATIEDMQDIGLRSFMPGYYGIHKLCKGSVIIIRYATPNISVSDCIEVIRHKYGQEFTPEPENDKFVQRVKKCVTIPELGELLYDCGYHEYQDPSKWECGSEVITTNFAKIGSYEDDPYMALRFSLN